jgi:hypothetical protein
MEQGGFYEIAIRNPQSAIRNLEGGEKNEFNRD